MRIDPGAIINLMIVPDSYSQFVVIATGFSKLFEVIISEGIKSGSGEMILFFQLLVSGVTDQ